MAKKNKKKGMGFAIFMALYALVVLVAMGFGLYWFWGFMEAYEASRPHVTIDEYLESLTPEHILSKCDGVLAETDLNIQDEKECRDYLLGVVSKDLTYARKASACTETEQTYVLRSGSQVLGTFVIASGEPDEYGFTRWTLQEENFDLSSLMGTETITVTVPEGYTVLVNGVQLDESYITQQEVREYGVLKELYNNYEVPELVLCTYEAGPFLNAEYEMEVFDPEGKPFVMDENFDENLLISITDEALLEELDGFLAEFIDVYVIFAGCANDSQYSNYSRVMQYVVPGSKLAQRMREALDGLQFSQSKGDEVADIHVNHYIRLSEGSYLCDVTYKVNTIGHEGEVQTTTNCKILIVRTDSGLLVESMIGY